MLFPVVRAGSIAGLFLLFLCLSACQKERCIASPNCGIVPDAGPCEQQLRRYYYDPEMGKCMEFLWSGCAGSVPFETLEECETCLCNRPQEI